MLLHASTKQSLHAVRERFGSFPADWAAVVYERELGICFVPKLSELKNVSGPLLQADLAAEHNAPLRSFGLVEAATPLELYSEKFTRHAL